MKNFLAVLLLALPFSVFAGNDPKEPIASSEAITVTSTMFTGTVTNMEDFKPVADVHIEISCKDSGIQKKVTTNEKGKFTFEELPEGVYNVTIKRKGFDTISRTQKISEGAKLNLGFMLLQS